MADTQLKKVDDHETVVDIQIAAGMICLGLLNPQGVQAVQQVLQGANDPAAAIAHVVFLAMSKVRMALKQKNIELDDKIWIMGGGVLDRVLVEVMLMLVGVAKFQDASNPQFVHKVKSDILDLMDDDDSNSESMKVLHDRGLPMPKAPPGADDQSQGGGDPSQQQQQQAPQGLAAPQGGMQ